MKNFVGILAALVICMAVWKVWTYYENLDRDKQAANQETAGAALPSLPGRMEQELTDARKKGAPGLKVWLDRYKDSPALRDPRLAAIQLDYLVLLSQSDPVQAKRIFADVKKRTPPNSPVWPRVQELEKTFE